MPNKKAYIYSINPEGSGQDENASIHQTAPTWVLTFVRWADRDTLRHKPTADLNYQTTRSTDPLVVENDCIQVSTNVNKSTLTHSMSATLVQTDVNYMTDVAPGDFVFVNMLNWPKDARRVADNARGKLPINGVNDGFKGMFKVQSVRKSLQVDPNTGVKMLVFRISGFAFTEFNNTIYFQPEMITSTDSENIGLYTSNIGLNWAAIARDKALTNGQDLIKALIQSLIGSGIGNDGKQDKLGNLKSPNTLFYIPQLVGTLLGVKGAVAAKDVYNYLFGIQQYASGDALGIANGFNPANISASEGRFTATSSKCRGESLQKPEYWNQVKVWSILNQFTNAPLNELFSSFRVDKTGRVMPTIVYRQIPFTNEDFKSGNYEVTKFMNLPRWKINPAMVLAMDIGRDEAARINFVQYFGRSSLDIKSNGVSEQTAQKNYLFDIDDVKRSGLRPYVISSTFDITTEKSQYESPLWARIVGDALIGGHLKLNGTFEVVGIVAPISVGDNMEFDGVVYHIEEVSHTSGIDATGKKIFRTKISASSGLSVDSSESGTKYAEMTHSSGESIRQNDWQNNQLLPGVSESQDVVYRPESLDTPLAQNGPFVQPDTGAALGNSVRDSVSEKDKK